MKYFFYQKSHCETPDIEKEIKAENIIEAVKYLCQKVSPYYCDYPAEDLFRSINLEENKPKPFEDKLIDELLKKIDKEQKGKWEAQERANKKEELILKLQKFLAEKGLFEELIDFLTKEQE